MVGGLFLINQIRQGFDRATKFRVPSSEFRVKTRPGNRAVSAVRLPGG